MTDKTPYKIIFRKDNSENPAALWQASCPLLLEAVQIFRDTASSQAFLQIKVKNISSEAVERFTFLAKVAFEDGDFQAVQEQVIDADIPPGAERAFGPYLLGKPLATSAEAIVSSLVLKNDKSWAYDKSLKTPEAKQPYLSEESLEERKKQLSEKSLSPETYSHAIIDGEDWWICPCGSPNAGTQECKSCQITKDFAVLLSSEEQLRGKAQEREELEAKKAAKKQAFLKTAKKAGVCAAALALCLGIYGLLIEPIIAGSGEGAYILTKEYNAYSDETTSYKIDRFGNVTKATVESKTKSFYIDEGSFQGEFGGETIIESKTNYSTNTYGLITKSSTKYSDGSSQSCRRTVDETDELGRPVKITEKSSGKTAEGYSVSWTTTSTIGYYDDSSIKSLERTTALATETGTELDDYTVRTIEKNFFNKAGRITDCSIRTIEEDSAGHVQDESSQCADFSYTGDGVTDSCLIDGYEYYEYEYDANGNLTEIYDDGDLVREYSYQWIDNASPWALATSKLLIASPVVDPLSYIHDLI